MSEAPERIWAQDAEPSECDFIGGGWWDDNIESVPHSHTVEYVRADRILDLVDHLRMAMADKEAAEAKLERAVETLEKIQHNKYGISAARARTTVAELKGQTDD